MHESATNPFEITKAVDFTDSEINEYWIDISGSGFHNIIKPASPMPMFILGGKGSGKTHLMRYFSYDAQKARHDDLISEIKKDGYIGIYMRCAGLNSFRFDWDGDDPKKWVRVFSYYMDIWLSQLTVKTIIDLDKHSTGFLKNEKEICREIFSIFGGSYVPEHKNLNLLHLSSFLLKHQKIIDIAVNNYPFTKSLTIENTTIPGELVFKISKIFSTLIPELESVIFSFFIDEFENLTKEQQKYINTLVREKELPCSFKIGSRLYGLKTFETYSAGEVNIEGAEYELVHIDSMLRNQNQANYKIFCKELCLSRLTSSGHIIANSTKKIDSFFDTYPSNKYSHEQTKFIINKYDKKERPYFSKLRKKLITCYESEGSRLINNKESIQKIIKNLHCIENPIIEKANIHMLYQGWYKSENLLATSLVIKNDTDYFKKTKKLGKRHDHIIEHFGGDFLAQILRSCNKKQKYLGIDTFIDMSSGLPRNFLIILKHIFQWAAFHNEQPFMHENTISMESQRKGVLESADWFLRNARIPGEKEKPVRAGIENIARLFRALRFADKPSECSLSTFSTNLSNISDESARVIDLAEKSLLLIHTSGRRDRNTLGVIDQYQINPICAPKWDLPISRRGGVTLSGQEVDAIFDESQSGEFNKFFNQRVERMTAPKFGSTIKQNTLPGL
jgi:hypothetical protein